MVFNTPMSFDDANKTCSDNASYLADSNNLKILLKSCDDNTTLFHAGISPQSGGTEMECVTVRMLDGIIQQDGPRNCSEKLPFVCIKKGSNAMDNVCRTVNNVSVPHVSNDQAKNSVTSMVDIFVFRKRDKTNKRAEEGKATFVNKNNYDAERSSKSGQGDSSCAVHINSQIGGEYGILGEKPSNSPDEDMYSHSRQHQQEGEYDLFAKPVNEPTGIYDHTHNIRQIEGGEYGELGKRVQDVADDDVYSHTKHSKAEGEYDSFSKPTESKNEGDIYDRAHNVLMESAYDEFKKDKDKTSPEGLYDHT
ncbi:uncharacterized protein LOC132555602 [Ylistrum balloti]|uniref:uncharacterized protein LOC132555602 n=1 Tax=Ylistrum balloti TaxID=509963 RepID=UPI0029059C76|nr:uncharacterized protein LOC132555602 [Ylistrum balloti]